MMTDSSLLSAVETAVSDDRFWARIKEVKGCWEWQGYRDRQGYGKLTRNGHNLLAHRYAFELINGPTVGVVRHSCDNPSCINPTHLQVGSQKDNIDDRQRRGRHRPGRMPGEAHPMHRLTDDQVRTARRFRAEGVQVKVIARVYGTSYQWMQQILSGKAWSHLDQTEAA